MSLGIDVVCVLLALSVISAAGYLTALCVIGVLSRPANRAVPPTGHECRFAILVPAHDEEAGLAATLDACRRLDYCHEKVAVFVVADNCTDGTARVARTAGANVLERFDREHRGKGHALAWAMPLILREPIDAVAVIDADCRPERNFLLEVNSRLQAGARAVQASVVVADPDSDRAACLAALGCELENDLFYAAKDQLGLAVFLRGTGMALHRALFEAVPWAATSATEDHEYSLQLLRRGERIAFTAATAVRTPAAGDRGLGVQRRRWASSLSGLPAVAGSLCAEGIARRRWRLIDAAMTHLVMSRPLVLAHALATISVLAAAHAVWATPATRVALLVCLAALGAHLFCLVVAFAKLGPTARRFGLLAGALPAAGSMLVASLGGILGYGRAWIRTPRSEVGA